MTVAFGWKYELIAFDPLNIKDAIEDGSPTGQDFCTIPSEAVTITELRVMAEVSSGKELKSSSSGATISLFNVSDDTLFYLQDKNTVILKAGWVSQEELPILFVGTIVSSNPEKNGADTKTVIKCSDSKFARDQVDLQLSLPPETYTYRRVIEALLGLAGKAGVPSEFVTTDGIVDEKLDAGFTFDGLLFRELEKFCSSIQYKVVYHLGRIRVEPKQYDNSTTATTINKDNILQGIHKVSKSKGVSSTDTESTSGLKFKTFLNGGITVNGDVVNGIDLNVPVFIDIAGYEGLYDPKKVSHKMDSEGSEWTTEVEVVRRV